MRDSADSPHIDIELSILSYGGVQLALLRVAMAVTVVVKGAAVQHTSDTIVRAGDRLTNRAPSMGINLDFTGRCSHPRSRMLPNQRIARPPKGLTVGLLVPPWICLTNLGVERQADCHGLEEPKSNYLSLQYAYGWWSRPFGPSS
jgi:hypothetical protein